MKWPKYSFKNIFLSGGSHICSIHLYTVQHCITSGTVHVNVMSACHLSDRCQCVLRGVVASPAVRHHRHAAWRSPGPEDAAGLLRGHRRKAEHHHEDVQGRGEQGGGRGAPRSQHHQQKHRREIHHLIPELQHGERRGCVRHDRTRGGERVVV